MVTSTITPAEVGGLVAAPVGFMRPKDIQRLAEMHSGATTVQIANLSFGGWTEPVYAATALAAKDAELAAERAALRLSADRADRAEAGERAAHDAANTAMRQRDEARAQLAEAMKALGMMLKEHDILSGNFGDVMDPKHKRPDRWPTAAEAARRALTGGKNG